MQRRPLSASLAALLAALTAVPAASAVAAPQWSTDVAVNQVVSGATSDQNQPKVAAAIDGGYWVSWLDGIGSGWDVRIQRFDVHGQALLGPQGILVADRGFSSTQDYGLDVAPNGDALLAFRDDRGATTEITAARITPSGTAVFGASGVTLSSGGAFVAAPKISSDGNLTHVAWTENSRVHVRGISATGTSMGMDVLLAPTVGSYLLSDMHSAGADAIVSFVHVTGGFTAPKHLKAHRIAPNGALAWGPSPVAIFDGGSLQFGNFPIFSVDDAETSLFTWYSAGPTLECFAQRIAANGAELWPHGGVAVSTASGGVRVNPTAALDPSTGDVLVTWVEQNALQSLSGISAQRISPAGTRLWSDSGVSVAPVGGSGAGFPKVFPVTQAGDVFLAWEEEPSFGTDQLFGARLDISGNVAVPRFDVASTPSGKARLTGTPGRFGGVLLAWSDQRNDGGDLYAQQFDFDGTPGQATVLSTATCAGVPNTTGLGSQSFVTGNIDHAANDITLWAVDLPQNSFGFFLASRAAGLVMGPGGSVGNLCLGGSIGRFVGAGQIQNSGPEALMRLDIDLMQLPTPNGLVAAMAGEEWFFQAWHREFTTVPTSNFSGASSVTFQ